MKPDDPISMYVPARNAEGTLADCVAAIRAQTRPPDELYLVVDPRSHDGTMDAARRLGVPVHVQTGRSLGAARNQAIHVARHRWLASCDSDVFLEPQWLARLAARRGEQAVGIGGATLENARSPFDHWRA
ncbi:MAG: glycosyltransferase family 2 protein, partial [Planctomycetes bacterium]|nr:glycosyltransferase family 2 protein [Planctomycetota bacterium]